MTEQAIELKIGEHMPDGTVYAGISPGTRRPMYTTPTDVPVTLTFNQARRYAKRLNAHGHQDWHVPTLNELTALFNNRALIGGFNSGSRAVLWHWSSSPFDDWDAWAQRFDDGKQNYRSQNQHHSSVRLVRDGPAP
jgi:Protein of unknown function (DUF1566)